MPIYEYKCPSCEKVFEEWTRSHDTDPQPCPDCGTSSPHIVSNTSFVLKGGGWYVSEYGKNSASGTKSASDAVAGAEASATGDAKPADAPGVSDSVTNAGAADSEKKTTKPDAAPSATAAPNSAASGTSAGSPTTSAV